MSMPRRRFWLTVNIGADEWDGLLQALRQLEADLSDPRRDRTRTSIASGAPDVGYSAEGDEDATITHDSYFAAVDAWKAVREKLRPSSEKP